ncbi:MAG: MFS transporter [Chloroflexi bacterium]|nr:MFS transporter [Chloroflexota bacterium]
MALFASLRGRGFALLWGGQSVSRLGDSVYRIALAWWVLEETGSPRTMGAVLVFAFAPMLLFLLIGGVVVDRLPRIGVMLASDLIRGALVAGIAALAVNDSLEIWHIFLASAVFGLVDAFFQPAYAAAVPQLTPADALPSANSLTTVSQQAIGIGGPALGALLVATGGTSTAFTLDAATFFISAGFLVFIPGRSHRVAGGEPSDGWLTDLGAGLRAVSSRPFLWVTIAVAALANVTISGPHNVALPFLINDVRSEGVGAFGLILSFTGAGAVAAAVVLGRFKHVRRRGWLTNGALLLQGALLTVYATGAPLPVLLTASVFEGACLATFGLIWVGAMQELVPQHLLGRVASIDSLGSYALLPLGYAAAGWASARFGPAEVLAGGGVATMAIAAAGFLHPQVRGLD